MEPVFEIRGFIMLKHIGTQNIETERLLLRKFKSDDAGQVFNNWAKDPDNVKYLTWKAHEKIGDTLDIINKWIDGYKNKDFYRWCITLKETGEVIGGIDVVDIIEFRSTCEIGYVLSKKYWNNGFMTEALRAVINYLFGSVGFNRIQLLHLVDNPASGKVMIKCGMKCEGILRQYGIKNTGEYSDTAIYSILRREYEYKDYDF